MASVNLKSSVCLYIETKGGGVPHYINSQEDPSISELPFGRRGTIGNNGCGMVALYNVLAAKGYNWEFEEFNSMDRPNMTILDGKLGMSPIALHKELCTFFGSENVDLLGFCSSCQYDAIIVMYEWKGDGLFNIGAHYFAAIREFSGIYTPYNDCDISADSIDSILSQVYNNQYYLWCVWGINF